MAPTRKSKGKKDAAKMERLDVEEDEARQMRLQSLLEHLSTSDALSPSAPPFTSTATSTSTFPTPKNLGFDFGNRTTAPFVPNTELLSRIQSFLPALEASNRALLERARVDPRSVDIENLDADDRDGKQEDGKTKADGRVIEMNLGLGVFEQKITRQAGSKRARSGSPSSTFSMSSCSSTSNDDSSDSSSSSGSSDSDSSDSDSGDEDVQEGEDDTLTRFFNSLRYGQTLSLDSSDSSCGSSCSGSEIDGEGRGAGEGGDEGGDGGDRERKVKPLPKRVRPRIEVLDDERGTME